MPKFGSLCHVSSGYLLRVQVRLTRMAELGNRVHKLRNALKTEYKVNIQAQPARLTKLGVKLDSRLGSSDKEPYCIITACTRNPH